jgi:hypothetical protein
LAVEEEPGGAVGVLLVVGPDVQAVGGVALVEQDRVAGVLLVGPQLQTGAPLVAAADLHGHPAVLGLVEAADLQVAHRAERADADLAVLGHRQPKRAEHLHLAVGGLGDPHGRAGLHSSGGRVRVEGVVFALAPSGSPVGPVDLDDDLAVGAQPARQPSAVAASALHTDPVDAAKRARPGKQRGVASRGGRDRTGAKQPAGVVEHGSDMGLGMGCRPPG